MVEIPGESLTVDMDKEVNMVLSRRLVELMAAVEPPLYRKRRTLENGKKVLYLGLHKALYGTLLSGLMLYEKLLGDLQ